MQSHFLTLQSMAASALAGVIYPLWLMAGAADLLCHRRTRLAATSGVIESLLHLCQLGCVGSAVLIVLFLDINRLTFAIMALLISAHAAFSFADVAYTDLRRRISPIEQHIHAYLEVLPWLALFAVAVVYWPAIADGGWEFRARSSPISAIQVTAVLLPALLLAVMPATVEFIDAWRHRPQRPLNDSVPLHGA